MIRLHWKARELATEDYTGYQSRVDFDRQQADSDQLLRPRSGDRSIEDFLQSNSIGRRLRQRSPVPRSSYWWPQAYTESPSSSSDVGVGARSDIEVIDTKGGKAIKGSEDDSHSGGG